MSKGKAKAASKTEKRDLVATLAAVDERAAKLEAMLKAKEVELVDAYKAAASSKEEAIKWKNEAAASRHVLDHVREEAERRTFSGRYQSDAALIAAIAEQCLLAARATKAEQLLSDMRRIFDVGGVAQQATVLQQVRDWQAEHGQ
jgi:hypothetical protein